MILEHFRQFNFGNIKCLSFEGDPLVFATLIQSSVKCTGGLTDIKVPDIPTMRYHGLPSGDFLPFCRFQRLYRYTYRIHLSNLHGGNLLNELCFKQF